MDETTRQKVFITMGSLGPLNDVIAAVEETLANASATRSEMRRLFDLPEQPRDLLARFRPARRSEVPPAPSRRALSLKGI